MCIKNLYKKNITKLPIILSYIFFYINLNINIFSRCDAVALPLRRSGLYCFNFYFKKLIIYYYFLYYRSGRYCFDTTF